MEFPPEPDYDLNQFFSDDSAFDSDPEIERPTESDSEDGLEEAESVEADTNIEQELQEDEPKRPKKKSSKKKTTSPSKKESEKEGKE